MTVRALFLAMKNMILDDPTIVLGKYVNENCPSLSAVDLLSRLISICTMDETVLYYKQGTDTLEGSAGNPTEVALLSLVHDLGMNFEKIRNTTRGRSSVGKLGEFLSEGKMFGFSSARKMMSWAVPTEDGGYRIYCKKYLAFELGKYESIQLGSEHIASRVV